MMPAVFCWSGGKDSALCLYEVLIQKRFEVKYLLTSVNGVYGRISMHGVSENLLDEQASSIGIPIVKMYVYEGTNSEYEKKMKEALIEMRTEGINHVIFGDIFLEDLRRYRENNLEKIGMKGVFPLWKRNTKELLQEFLRLNFRSIVCCTNSAYLGEEWVGRNINQTFPNELPQNVDPCGENGEYHSFCYDGPIFRHPIKFLVGEKVFKLLEVKTSDSSINRGFWYCNLLKDD